MTALAEQEKELQLEEAFAAFASTAHGLEAAYHQLVQRTERLDLELHEANQQLQALFTALPAGVVAADRDGIITTVNAAARRMLGIDTRTNAVLRIQAFHDSEGAPIFLPSPGPEDRELSIGEDKTRVRTRYIPLQGRGEALWILEDRTELEALEGQVAHLDQLASLGRMSLSIAHEIRNPLNGISGFAGLLRKRVEEPKAVRYCERISDGVRRVDAIIRNLLAFARPTQLVRRTIDLAEVVQATLADWSGGKVVVDAPDGQALIEGDSTACRQILENLMRNAIEAGGEDVPIRISLEQGGGSWVLAVEDEGPGIPVKMREAVFEPFRSEKEGGTGLGLAIVQRIVELHRGRVRAVSPRQGSGARFEVALPAGGDRGR